MTTEQQDKLALSFMLAFAIGAFVFAAFALQVDQSDIDACVENTNYTEQRCIFELTR